jgi:phosphate transport system substrate-binding protein
MLKKLGVAVGVALLAAGTARAANISGAGATAPMPVYTKWAEGYRAQTGNAINYQGIGSGGGIKQIEANTVDFGASDKPLSGGELAQHDLLQFPTVIVGIVPVVNLPGVRPGQLKLTGPVLADIFEGAIKRWGDPRIAQLNPGVRLPNLPITVVHRSDGSGTTFLYTSYLSAVSPSWRGKVGASDSVQWPAGQGGKGNDGVAAFVKQTAGSIGYVEYAFAKVNNLTFALLGNHDGKFPPPSEGSFQAAAAGADWAKAAGFAPSLLNQRGPNAWPISGATFILIHKAQRDPAKGAAVLRFLDWAYTHGDPTAVQLAYVPLPAQVKAQVRRAWPAVKGPNGQPVYAPR